MTDQLRLQDFVPYRLSVASNITSDIIAGSYRALFGLNIPEWRLIAVLAESDARTQSDLCTATQMDKVTVSRAAIALVGRSLIKRAPNPQDKRSHLLLLTDSGRALYSQVVPQALALEKELLADFSPRETEALLAMLRCLQARAEGMLRPPA